MSLVQRRFSRLHRGFLLQLNQRCFMLPTAFFMSNRLAFFKKTCDTPQRCTEQAEQSATGGAGGHSDNLIHNPDAFVCYTSDKDTIMFSRSD